MKHDEQVPETRGVTSTLLATVDLGPEIEGMEGRQLRMRLFTFEPGCTGRWAARYRVVGLHIARTAQRR